MNDATINILLVEDNEDHVFLTKRALRNSGLPLQISVASDGDEALAWIAENAVSGHENRPDLILLDLKLPGRDGFEVLQELKGNENYRAIPVVLLTSSDAEADVLRGYGLSANSYVTKPIKMEEMLTKLQQLPGYWTQINHLPPK